MTNLRIKIKAALLFAFVFLLHMAVVANSVMASDTYTLEDITFERCYIDNIETAANCFDIEVPLNWEKPDAQKINIHGVIIAAKSMRSDPDPLVILAGGPGQAATDYGGLVSAALHKINERRDIILIDQRGTGGSNALKCDFPEEFTGDVPAAQLRKFGRECAQSFDIDVRYFTSLDILKDLEFIRASLGIESVNLWGGSYGTRLGLLYMKHYPDSVRSAILDGVAPPNDSLFRHAAESAEAAWRKLVAACEADPGCHAAYPALDARFRSLLQQLKDKPADVTYKDIASGKIGKYVASDAWLAESIRSALYVPTYASVLPFALQRAEAADYSVLNALAANAAAWAGSTMDVGSTLSILCREDVPTITAISAEQAGADSFHRDYYYKNWAALCSDWPVLGVPQGYNTPVASDIPTLLLSGGLDPVTPPAMASVAERSLSNALHLIAENAGHNVSPFGCAPKLMADFVKKASIEGLEGECLNDPIRPAFVLTPAGNTP